MLRKNRVSCLILLGHLCGWCQLKIEMFAGLVPGDANHECLEIFWCSVIFKVVLWAAELDLQKYKENEYLLPQEGVCVSSFIFCLLDWRKFDAVRIVREIRCAYFNPSSRPRTVRELVRACDRIVAEMSVLHAAIFKEKGSAWEVFQKAWGPLPWSGTFLHEGIDKLFVEFCE